jgi:hypothetical protein
MIIQSLPRSFKLELLQGIHDFTTDVFRLALYTNEASLTAATTVYSSTNEVSAIGYAPGGTTVTAVAPAIYGDAAVVTFNPAIWTSDDIVARGGLVYNQTKDNRAVAILNFGSDRTPSSGLFTVSFQAGSPSTGLIRIK